MPAHEILREADPVRLDALARIDAFLGRARRMTDVAIVGAGMAGASLAAELAGRASVLILEAESQPGYHATGRSAAFWSESYGGPLIQPLTSASGPFLADHGFLKPRGAIHLADAGGAGARWTRWRRRSPKSPLQPLDRAALEAAIPGLKPGWDRGLAEPSCADIDVAGAARRLSQAARAQGACSSPMRRLIARRAARRAGGSRRRAGAFEADILVNAAGAWADEVALRCGRAAARHPALSPDHRPAARRSARAGRRCRW